MPLIQDETHLIINTGLLVLIYNPSFGDANSSQFYILASLLDLSATSAFSHFIIHIFFHALQDIDFFALLFISKC